MITEYEAYQGYEEVFKRMDLEKLPHKTVWMLGAVWASEVEAKRIALRFSQLSSNLNTDAITEAVATMLKENPDAFINTGKKG